uniref:butyryl-CoA:acetate CoA-transferase n=1 Tax=Eubacterium cellulosolvens TaxID=29322 RepID=UPI00047F93D9|nr:butyryl-CoA:acetate CoA-transferase [[Eubacterium] cellulosolvens]
MDYSQKYNEKLVSAEKAASVIKSGDWVDYGWCVGTNVAVDKALAKRMPELHDVKIRGGILCHEPEIFKIENPAEHFTWNSWHMNPVERHNVNNGFVFMTPLRYSELPRLYRDMKDPLNVAICQVSPMDAHGYFNFGPCTSHMQAVVDKADVVIVEVNKNMPVCLGGTGAYIHIDQVDMVVEGENPAIDEIPAGGPASEIDKAVAKLVVPEIPNGACLQLGIGGMPNAIGQMIAESDLKDLGIHTEMYVDAFVDMANAGKITGRNKNIDKGRQTYAFGAGTKKLYDYLDNNPECMAAPVEYVNDVRTIASLDNFISINNAVDIDLFGQVNAESAGIKNISGAGGQQDFVLGAYLSNGGKSFICLSSTFMNKKTGKLESRIRPTLQQGSIATDTRTNTMYIVTEFGMVNLKGLTMWQRAESLINIAHPECRDELIAEAEKMNIWRRSNKR